MDFHDSPHLPNIILRFSLGISPDVVVRDERRSEPGNGVPGSWAWGGRGDQAWGSYLFEKARYVRMIPTPLGINWWRAWGAAGQDELALSPVCFATFCLKPGIRYAGRGEKKVGWVHARAHR